MAALLLIFVGALNGALIAAFSWLELRERLRHRRLSLRQMAIPPTAPRSFATLQAPPRHKASTMRPATPLHRETESVTFIPPVEPAPNAFIP
ncbi:MAG TPA: hypothetical protein PKE07_08595 [Lacibacter sp.]|nr:hypothetical protein [Lacibacter sp.]HMO90062.1 hypothetical protein [Lacibacter sp.]